MTLSMDKQFHQNREGHNKWAHTCLAQSVRIVLTGSEKKW
jgi:hypothetical protein